MDKAEPEKYYPSQNCWKDDPYLHEWSAQVPTVNKCAWLRVEHPIHFMTSTHPQSSLMLRPLPHGMQPTMVLVSYLVEDFQGFSAASYILFASTIALPVMKATSWAEQGPGIDFI